MTIGVGIVGFGFMGRTHLQAYRAAAADGFDCRLSAITSTGPIQTGGRIAGNLAVGTETDLAGVHICDDARALAADPDIQLVSICTPTDTHIELASLMLRAGKHVLVEKPVSLDAGECHALGLLARATGRLCMAAMCMRFWPGWDWLRDRIRDRSFGRVKSAAFTRLGSRPGWAPEFYKDPARCGGAAFDLHLHDADIIRWLFGHPEEVSSAGTIDHICTLYRYPGGPALVTAEGGWVEQPGFPFRMRYTVEFEHAIADWDLTRPERLLLTRDSATEPVPLPEGTGYDGQVRAILRALERGEQHISPDMEDAAATVELILAEKRSALTGRPVALSRPGP